MTVPVNEVSYNQWTGNGVTTVFNYGFKIANETELKVTVRDTDGNVVTKTLSTHYTVQGVADPAGGTVTMLTAVPDGHVITIEDNVPFSQEIPFSNQGRFFASAHERAFDKLTRLILRVFNLFVRAIHAPYTDADVSMELPSAIDRANKYLAFGPSGELQMAEELSGSTLSQPTIGAYLWPRTPAEIAAAITPTNYYFEPGDVRRYGAVGDGVTDDYAAFAAAILQNHQSGSAPIRSWQNTCIINTGLHWCSGGQDSKIWISENTILSTAQDIDLLTIGPSSGGIEAMSLTISGLLSVLNTSGQSVSTKIGIRFGCVYSSRGTIAARGFKTGIKAIPDGSGFVYNVFTLGDMRHNYDSVWLDPQGTGWTNENTFIGGRFAFKVGETSRSHIYMPKNAVSRPNNNMFLHPALEGSDEGGATATAGYIDGGRANMLIQPRFECDTPLDKAIVWIQESAIGYHVEAGIYGRLGENLGGTYNPTILNEGGPGTIIAPDQFFMSPTKSAGATSAIKILRGDPNTSNKLPVVDFRDLYSTSGPSQLIQTVLARNADSESYHFNACSVGSIVSNGEDTGTGKHYYECIQTHTPSSGAASEPGVGNDWRAYWERLHGFEATSIFTAANTNPWTSGTPYTARATVFKLRADGGLQVNLITASALSGTKKLLTLYDSNGTAYYIEAYPTKA